MITLKEFLALEARYPGNIGMMEMARFFQVASAEEKTRLKKLISDGREEEAWKFMQRVTGKELEDA